MSTLASTAVRLARLAGTRVPTRVATARLRLLSSEATAAAAAPDDLPVSDKVLKLLDEIVLLNMLEVKQLSTGLKDRLGIADAAPMMGMPMGMPIMGGSAQAAETEEPAAEVQTHFDVKLEAFDAGKKIQIIKEVRTLTALGLKEAKALVDAAPGIVKSAVPKEDAEQMKATLTDLGATISLE